MTPRLLPSHLLLLLALVSCVRHDEREERARLSQPRLEPLVAPQATGPNDRHLLLTLRLTEAELTVLDLREVALPLPLNRGRKEEPWRVQVEDRLGQLLYLAQLPAPAQLRGEFPRPDGTIEAVHPTSTEQFLSIRLPILPAAATVRLFGPPRDSTTLAPMERGKASLPTPVVP